MMYVFQVMFFKETGQANWLRRPAALTARLEKAIPLARCSNESTSTGYRACRGVIPMEKTDPNMKIMASEALDASWLLYMGLPSSSLPAYEAEN